MQIFRTIGWVILLIALTAFIAINWNWVPVRFWPQGDGTFLSFQWPVGLVALLFFVIGLVPMWLLHKGASWRWNRRIGTLENSVRAASTSSPVAVPVTAHPDPVTHEPVVRWEPPARPQ
jgi:putative membrane protein